MMRLLVCGSRHWTDSTEIAYHMALIFGKEADRLVIHGNCGNLRARPPRGADVLAGWLAAGVGAACAVYPVDHRLDGPWPNAGPRRNERMFRESKPTQGLAFGDLWTPNASVAGPQVALFRPDITWEPTGTGGMVKIMLDAWVPVRWVAAPGARYVDLVEMPRP